jgi:hypothetical protein
MAKSDPNFYLLQEDSGEIIGIIRSPNKKESIRNALQDRFNVEIDMKDIHCKAPAKNVCERGWVNLAHAIYPFTITSVKVY